MTDIHWYWFFDIWNEDLTKSKGSVNIWLDIKWWKCLLDGMLFCPIRSCGRNPFNRVPSTNYLLDGTLLKCQLLAGHTAYLTIEIPSQAALAHWLKWWYYRQLVYLRNRVPINLWTKLWHLWGRTKGGFEGVGEIF